MHRPESGNSGRAASTYSAIGRIRRSAQRLAPRHSAVRISWAPDDNLAAAKARHTAPAEQHLDRAARTVGRL